MNFDPPLVEAKLIKRYKRFLADVIHPQLGEITVHCPNTGSMKNCWQKGWPVWLQKSDNPKRKYPYTWVLTQDDQGDRLCINTHLANPLVATAVETNKIAEIGVGLTLNREVKYGQENSRIDLLTTDNQGKKNFIEVKSVTLKESDGLGYFPDAQTLRGQKHIRELIQCKADGHDATLFFMVMHTGINQLKMAQHIDPVYADLIQQAVLNGVKILAYKASINSDNIALDHRIEILL
ncbi:MAG: DNA/RNA nuclease SfsA [Enterobacterales bacterium]|nr:DNA/RNA nuclease SfsA [Enterobacterales bacterium]